METFMIEVEETVRVAVSYRIKAADAADALRRFNAGDLGRHVRNQDGDAEYVIATHHETAAVFQG